MHIRVSGGRARFLGGALALALLAAPSARAEGETLRVPEDYALPTRALRAADDGDTIRLAAGVYEVRDLVIDRRVTIRGAGVGATRVRGTVALSDGATLEGLTISGEGASTPSPLVTLNPGDGGEVVLRDLSIEGAPGTGLLIARAGSVTVERVAIRRAGGHGIEVRRWVLEEFFPWPRPTLRQVVVREAGQAGLCVAEGAGGRFEGLDISGSKGADVTVSGPLTCPSFDAGALRVTYEDGAVPYTAESEKASRAAEAAEREARGPARTAPREVVLRARSEMARIVRTHRAALQSPDEARHREGLTAYVRDLLPLFERDAGGGYAVAQAIRVEVAHLARVRGALSLATWMRTAPELPRYQPIGSTYLGDLAPEERAAFTEAWLAERRARFEPILAALRDRSEPDADLDAAAARVVEAVLQVHAEVHPLEAPRMPEAAASRGAIAETLAAFQERNGGVPAGAALLRVAGDARLGGSKEALAAIRGCLTSKERREIDAWAREASQRAARARKERVSQIEACTTALDEHLAAAGDDKGRIADAYRSCIVDLAAIECDASSQGTLWLQIRAVGLRLLGEHGVEAYEAVYSSLPEVLGQSAVTREEALFAPLRADQKRALLRLVHRDEPWKVGHLLPVLRVPGDHATIQAAIDAAEPGQRIEVGGGKHEGPIKLRPHTQLFSRGGVLLHRQEVAILVEDCPGVTVQGLTIEPAQMRANPRVNVLGTPERAIVKVVRSEVTLSDVTVIGADRNWAIALIDSTGAVTGGQLVNGGFGGICATGPRSRVALEKVRISMFSGELIAVLRGAEVSIEGGDLSSRGDSVGILVAGEGSQLSKVDAESLALVRYESGARPSAEIERDLAERRRLVDAKRRALLDVYKEELERLRAAQARPGSGDAEARAWGDMLSHLYGYPGQREAERARVFAPPLVRYVQAMTDTSIPGDPADREALDRLIADQTRPFYLQHGIVPFTEVIQSCRDLQGLADREGEAVARSNQRRFYAFVRVPDQEYVDAYRRWLQREHARAGKGRREPHPWPTAWVRHRAGALPYSALLPGEDDTRDPNGTDRAGDGKGLDLRLHLHAEFRFFVGGECEPVGQASENVTKAQLDDLVRRSLGVLTQNGFDRGPILMDRELKPPYVVGGWQRSARTTKSGNAEKTWYRTDAVYVLDDGAGAYWQVRMTITGPTWYQDEVFTKRFFHSLRFER